MRLELVRFLFSHREPATFFSYSDPKNRLFSLGALKKTDIKPEQIEEVFFGNVLSAGLGMYFLGPSCCLCAIVLSATITEQLPAVVGRT